MGVPNKEAIFRELQRAICQLRGRGLYSAAKWAAEQMVGLQLDGEANQICPPASVVEGYEEEDDFYMYGKALFDAHEYRRAAHVLAKAKGNKAFFLRCYALFVAGEKRKAEERMEDCEAGLLERNERAINRELADLRRHLCTLYENGKLDAFCKYIYGVVLRESNRKAEAEKILIESVNDYPWNWNAWLALLTVCSEIDSRKIKNHWMKDFLQARAYLDFYRNRDGMGKYKDLQKTFCLSLYVGLQIARGHHQATRAKEAEKILEGIIAHDPYCIDGMDTHLNILFGRGEDGSDKFGNLAQIVHLADKLRPEACFTVGNYFSLKRATEKAVLFYERADKVSDQTYPLIWGFLGHIYTEFGNVQAAFDMYHRAVRVNRMDHRALLGLGNAYSCPRYKGIRNYKHMPHYALYFYNFSVCSSPNSSVAWVRLGNCYGCEEVNMPESAIECLERALKCRDIERGDVALAFRGLGRMHSKLLHVVDAESNFRKYLDTLSPEERVPEDEIEALEFLFYNSGPKSRDKDFLKFALYRLGKLNCLLGRRGRGKAYGYFREYVHSSMVRDADSATPEILEALQYLTRYLRSTQRHTEALRYADMLLRYARSEEAREDVVRMITEIRDERERMSASNN